MEKTYIIVSSQKTQVLEDLVVEKIQEGYMPIGGVAAKDFQFLQAMVWTKGLKKHG